ncbi:MAG: META domain-containing protein [bacterium]|nr:META domain-containing protein [bacterium]
MITRWVGLAVILLTLIGAVLPAFAQTDDALLGEWQLIAVGAVEDTAAVSPVGAVTLAFSADGQVSGSGACNQYTGTYTANAETTADVGTLTLSPLASTRRACTNEVRAALETMYFAAMETVSGYRIDDEFLLITYADGVLLFAPLDSLVGTRWALTSIPGAGITLAFGDDGRVSGFAGCNVYTGGYALDGSAITVSALAITAAACEPAFNFTAELAYTQALTNATAFDYEGETLILYTSTGEVLTFMAIDVLAGTAWALVTYGAETPVEGNPVTLLFDLEGRIGGEASCNRYGGAYVLEDDTLRFSGVFSTRRACLDQTLAAQETAYFAALGAAAGYQIDGDQLIIPYGDAGEQLVYRRAGA